MGGAGGTEPSQMRHRYAASARSVRPSSRGVCDAAAKRPPATFPIDDAIVQPQKRHSSSSARTTTWCGGVGGAAVLELASELTDAATAESVRLRRNRTMIKSRLSAGCFSSLDAPTHSVSVSAGSMRMPVRRVCGEYTNGGGAAAGGAGSSRSASSLAGVGMVASSVMSDSPDVLDSDAA